MIKIAPSILAADMLNMGADVQRMMDAGADMMHVDIMDAHFVPNLSYSPALVKALHSRFDIPLDVHLMMDNPEQYIDVFCDSGAAYLTIHAEIPGDVAGMLQRIREKGVKAGLSVKPGTPVEDIRPLLPLCDMVLVMTVEPGFGGQKFMPAMMDKVRAIKERAPQILIEVDGGVNDATIPQCVEAGVDICVAGTGVFRAENAEEALIRLQSYGA